MEFSNRRALKTLFIHLNATYGGAERLVLSLTEAFEALSCKVTLGFVQYSKTSSFDGFKKFPKYCFGSFIPSSIFGGLIFWCSFVRLLVLTLYIWWNSNEKYDVAVGDQIALINPILKLQARKVVFYLHFPEPKQSKPCKNFVYLLYRQFIQICDKFGLDYADEIWVNSNFTKSALLDTYPTLNEKTIHLIYPSVQIRDLAVLSQLRDEKKRTHFISVNRFETKKNIPLAVKAYAAYLDLATKSHPHLTDIRLKICGRFDNRVPDSIKSYEDTRAAVTALPSKWQSKIDILTEVAEPTLLKLLANSVAVIYTPSNEHFGIVPLEGMAAGTPVVAINNGGPTESIIHRETGSLVNPDAFADEMLHWACNNFNGEAETPCLKRAKEFSSESLCSQIKLRLASLN